MVLYNVVVLNEQGFPNRTEAAKVLAEVVGLSSGRAPEAWLRGNFQKYPVRVENFLRIVQNYRGKKLLETNRDIIDLAMKLYGADYGRVTSLIEIWPEDVDIREAEFRKKLNDLIAIKNADSVAIEAVAAYFGSNWKAMSIAVNIVEENITDWQSLEEKLERHPLIEKSKEVDSILSRMVDIAWDYFSPDQKLVFTKFGALPQLAYYDFAVFRALWQIPDDLIFNHLELFQNLNFVTKTVMQMWEIDKDILNIAKQYFQQLPQYEQKRIELWKKRRIRDGDILNNLRSNLAITKDDLNTLTDFGKLTQRREELGISKVVGSSWSQRFLKSFLPPGYYDSDWFTLQLFTSVMSPVEFLTAYYLHSLWIVALFDAIVLSQIVTVLFFFPVWRLAAFVFLFIWLLRIVMRIYKIEANWVKIWGDVMPKISMQKGEGGE